MKNIVKDRFKGHRIVIAFEGMKYAGKTTMIEALRKKIADTGKRAPKVFSEQRNDVPEWAHVQKMIDSPETPLNTKIALSLAQRVSVYEDQIKPEIFNGRCVFTEGSMLSSMVFHRPTPKHSSFDISLTNQRFPLSYRQASGVRPDVIVLLGIGHDTYMERLAKDTNRDKEVNNELTDPEVFQDYSDGYFRCLCDLGDATIIASKDVEEVYEKLKLIGCDF